MRLVEAMTRGLPPGYAYAIVDDIMCASSGTFYEHLDPVGMVFDKLIEAGFTMKASKGFLGMKEVKYFGVLVGKYGTKPDPQKIALLLDMAVEQLGVDGKAAARFAGMIGYYHKFIPHLHSKLRIFHDLKQAGAKAHEIMPSLKSKAAFECLMNDLVRISSLARPDFAKPFYIEVDTAASSSTSAVLSQRADPLDPDSHVPLAFRSRVLGGSEPGYPIRDQEGLGLVEALQEWRSTILGCEVIVRTDHKSLQWLMKTRHPDGSRIAGYALKVQEFQLTIEWNAATSKNIVAVNCFTRPPWQGNSPAITESKQELAYDEIMAS
jgi:hypothetical protein